MKIQLSEHFNYQKLIKFTLPTIIIMIFTSIYGVVDGLFVSNVVGDSAFASVNLIMPFIMILGSFGVMIGTGGSALISKLIGEGQKEKANKIFSMLILTLIITGIIFSIIGLIFIKDIAILLGADDSTLENSIIYGRVLLIALTSYLLQYAFQSFLIVAERPVFGLLISILSGVFNMLMDFLFIYVFKMGIFGAALATSLSQVIGGVIPIIFFLKTKKSTFKFGTPIFDKKALLQSCLNGSSEMLSNLSMSLVNMLYNIQLMKLIGPDGVVAYGIIMYVGFIFSGVYMGYSMGIAPVIGYHYGAKNDKELKSLLKKSLILISIASIVLTILAEVSAIFLASIFVSYNNDLMNLTTLALRLFVLSYLVGGINIFASSFFTALNNGLISALISFLRTLVFQVIMIFLLPIIFDTNGIWLSVVFAELLALIVSIICLITNRKKYNYF